MLLVALTLDCGIQSSRVLDPALRTWPQVSVPARRFKQTLNGRLESAMALVACSRIFIYMRSLLLKVQLHWISMSTEIVRKVTVGATLDRSCSCSDPLFKEGRQSGTCNLLFVASATMLRSTSVVANCKKRLQSHVVLWLNRSRQIVPHDTSYGR